MSEHIFINRKMMQGVIDHLVNHDVNIFLHNGFVKNFLGQIILLNRTDVKKVQFRKAFWILYKKILRIQKAAAYVTINPEHFN